MRHLPFICLLLCFGLYAEKTELQEDEITILLEDPVYTDGVLTSDKGVCVKAPGMKIQARKIEYIRKETAEGLVHKLSAFGDLLVDFNNRIYVGDSVDYDFITQSGYVTNGVTCIDRVFVGGEKLEFHKDKSITMQNLYATTNPNKNSLWSVEAKSATLDKDQVLKTEDITVKAGQTPVFYVPFYKTKFKSDDNSPFRYNVLWESGQGPMVSARARLYSTDALELFGRLDYRIKRG
ncbi:MAG: hypothetical protein FJZ56_06850, partial [Chlamydiae bacterium]|nr:hypothetical protein [Chlamydiota bacterium]